MINSRNPASDDSSRHGAWHNIGCVLDGGFVHVSGKLKFPFVLDQDGHVGPIHLNAEFTRGLLADQLFFKGKRTVRSVLNVDRYEQYKANIPE